MAKQGTEAQENIRKKHVDLFSVVLIALFDDIIEEDKETSVIEVHKFFTKLYSLKVLSSQECVDDLSSFLAHKNDTNDKNYIDVKRLATATGEFVRNQYLKSFGTSEEKPVNTEI